MYKNMKTVKWYYGAGVVYLAGAGYHEYGWSASLTILGVGLVIFSVYQS